MKTQAFADATQGSTKSRYTRNGKRSALMQLAVMAAACLLAMGCATTSHRNLTSGELGTLAETRTALIVADTVNAQHDDFFAGLFKTALGGSGVTVAAGTEAGQIPSNYDVVVKLRCFYRDYGRFVLNPSILNDTYYTPNPWQASGKQLWCHVTITHKALGNLFDGDIWARTAMTFKVGDLRENKITSREDFSSVLELNAQERFKQALYSSPAWSLVTAMQGMPGSSREAGINCGNLKTAGLQSPSR